MNGDLLLGLDLGTTRCKALLVDHQGHEVALTTARTPFRASEAGIEMPLEALWSELAGMLAALGADRDRIGAIGIAGIAECGVPLDVDGNTLAPVISWHDPRGSDVAERLEAMFGEAIGLRTGQRPRSVSTVAKLGWLVAHGCQGIALWLGVPEACLWALTGAQATEHSLASRTGCYDVIEKDWLEPVAQAAGFSTGVFPPVRRAGEAIGRVSAEAAGRWGLPEGVAVTIAGHDHLAGAVGAGAGPGDLVNSVGTAETVLGSMTAPPDRARALELRTPVSVAPGDRAWVVLAGAARAGVILAAASRALHRPVPELDALAAGLPEDGRSIDVSFLLEPLQNGVPVNLPVNSQAELWRALLQALAARTAEATQRVMALAGGERLMVIGGGARSDAWVRAKARVIDLPIVRPRTQQATARGAAIFAGVAAGWWPGPGSGPAPAVVELERPAGGR